MKVEVNIIFGGHVEVATDSLDEAKKIIGEVFGGILGNVYDNHDERIKDYDINTHGETVVTSEEDHNGQLRLRDLYECCRVQMAKGNGGKLLIVGDDNEGNGYHGMFFGVSPCDKETASLIYDSNETNPKNLLIIG